VRKGIQ